MTTILRHKIGEASYKDYELANAVSTVGRSSSNDIVVNDTSLSRLHFRLENRSGQFYVIDNNSSNGTFLNRRKITEAPLKSGDDLQAGRIHFSFVQRGQESGDQTAPMRTVEGDPAMASTMNLNLDEELTRTRSASVASFASPDGNESMPTEDVSQARERVKEMTPPPLPANEPAGDIPIRKPPELPPIADEPAPPPPPHLSGSGELTRAQPLQRLLAYLIDIGVAIALAIPGVIMGFLVDFLSSLLYALGSAASLAHVLGGWHKYGKTIGKHVMGLRVIEVGNPGKEGLETQTVLMRALGYFISGIPCGLGFLYIFFNEEGHGIQDKLAKTEVIQDNPQK